MLAAFMYILGVDKYTDVMKHRTDTAYWQETCLYQKGSKQVVPLVSHTCLASPLRRQNYGSKLIKSLCQATKKETDLDTC